MNYRIGACFYALLLASCGGTTTSAGNSGTSPQTASLVLAPASAAFSGSTAQQAQVAVSGASGALSFAVADPVIVRVTPVSSNSFTVTRIAGGSTTVKVTDATGASATFSVSTDVCEPPSPALDLVYPAPGSSNISASTSDLWLGLYASSNPVNSTIGDYYIYLIANDGTTIQGQHLVQNNGAPPAGSTPPAPGYTYTYYTSAISGLQSGKTYKAQLVDANLLCLPPLVYGTFTT